MIYRRLTTALIAVLLAGIQPLQAAASGLVQRPHIQVELLAESNEARPGTDLRVGLRLLPDPGWHTYWKNPGDSGLATSIEWTLPEGVTASEIAWPYPDAIPFAHLINYGYDGEHLLPVTLSIPDDLALDQPLRLEARADWLVCEEICIPGDADLDARTAGVWLTNRSVTPRFPISSPGPTAVALKRSTGPHVSAPRAVNSAYRSTAKPSAMRKAGRSFLKMTTWSTIPARRS